MNKKYWVVLSNGLNRITVLSKHAILRNARLEVARQLDRLEYGYSMIDRKLEWVAQYPIIYIVKMPENVVID